MLGPKMGCGLPHLTKTDFQTQPEDMYLVMMIQRMVIELWPIYYEPRLLQRYFIITF